MVDWKVWYCGGRSFSSADGAPWDAPKRGVICVAVASLTHGRAICRSSDFYIWSTYDGRQEWQGVDQFGLYDYLIEPGQKTILFGRTIGNEEYAAVLQRAVYDPDLPVKTCTKPMEGRT